MLQKAIIGIATLRLMSGTIEILAALLILKLNEIEKALLVNTALALVGPVVLLTTTSIGLISLSDKLSMGKILWIFAGVACIWIGIRK